VYKAERHRLPLTQSKNFFPGFLGDRGAISATSAVKSSPVVPVLRYERFFTVLEYFSSAKRNPKLKESQGVRADRCPWIPASRRHPPPTTE
jgi:hypothetical protein